MNTRLRPLMPALLLIVAGLLLLYQDALRTGFLNDDYLFLEAARSRSLVDALLHPDPLANYFRPLSRQVYYEALTAVGGGHPAVFHAVNACLFLAGAALLLDLLLVFSPPVAALAGVLWFATLPFQRVNLLWISCSQDLLALVGALAAVAFHRRGRLLPATLAALVAMLSKESALALPIALAAWSLRIDRAPWPIVARRLAILAVPALLWAAGTLALRRSAPLSAAPLELTPNTLAASLVHLVQTMLGIEHPPDLLRGWLEARPNILALVPLALAGWWLRAPGAVPERAPRARDVAIVAGVWFVASALVVAPVVRTWSSYHYTLAAVGGAMLVALALRPIRGLGWLALAPALLWWHAGATHTRAFAVRDDPWNMTSHLTAHYFERAARLTDRMRTALRRLEPAPPRETRFFFTTLPPFAGFQMGNGALLRDLYRDPTIASHFYSQFSDSTAADHPCRFMFWNGETFEPLYGGRARDPFFQVGCDLLLLERPAGAIHAFRRGLEAGETPFDCLYWAGWAYLWNGDRPSAERAWKGITAEDDSLTWVAWLRVAKGGLIDGDTTRARRALSQANLSGMGRPEGHAVLADLLRARSPKFALLESKVTAFLAPGDLGSRAAFVAGLVEARLDESAAREFERLRLRWPAWQDDSTAATAWRTLAARTPAAAPVMELER